MAKLEYLIVGESHIYAMGAPGGYCAPVGLIKTPDDMGYFVMEPGYGGRSGNYWRKAVEWSKGRDVLIVYGGNQHYGGFMFAPEPLFDFFDELTPGLVDGAKLVPRRLVEAYFEPSLNQLRLLIPQIFAAGCSSIRLIGTPPPKADLHAFTKMIRESEFAKGFAQRNGIDLVRVNITPASLLLKLWRVVQQLTAKAATDNHAVFVPVPAEAIDTQGFLAKPFYSYVPSHATHANRAFGHLMLEHALQTLTS